MKGIKKYHSSFRGRLPSTEVRGLLRDIRLHLFNPISDQRHIFVIGPPRSGTTLVRGIIAANSCVCTADRETFFFARRRISLFSLHDLPASEFQRIYAVSKSKVEVFDRIARYFKVDTGKPVFLEKTPEHAIYLPWLVEHFPASRFIFVLRDGRDCFASAFRNPEFARQRGMNYPFMWRDCVRALRSVIGKRAVQVIRYEEFVKNPEEGSRQIMDFIGLPLQADQLHPNRIAKTSMSKDKGHEKLSRSIDSQSVGSWKADLSAELLDRFERIAGRELYQMGYSALSQP